MKQKEFEALLKMALQNKEMARLLARVVIDHFDSERAWLGLDLDEVPGDVVQDLSWMSFKIFPGPNTSIKGRK